MISLNSLKNQTTLYSVLKSPLQLLLSGLSLNLTKTSTFNRLLRNEQTLFYYQSFLTFASSLNSAHVKRAMHLLPLSKGEIFQDIFVALCLPSMEKGFFVEFGATDGVQGSNTWMLEKELGWNGIVSEPGRCWHLSLAQNRNCKIVSDCVWAETGRQLEFIQTKDAGFSTLGCYTDNDRHSKHRANGKKYFVPSVSLHDMLVRMNAPRSIDYLSIDTEGSELAILSSFPFEKWNISILTIEHNFRDDRASMQDLIQGHGYVRVLPHLSRFDDWYVAPEILSQVKDVFE